MYCEKIPNTKKLIELHHRQRSLIFLLLWVIVSSIIYTFFYYSKEIYTKSILIN